MRLTKLNINALKIPEGKSEIIVFDEQLPGFGIRIRAGGKRSWVCQYRVGGSKQRRVSVGSVEALDPDEARKRAREILARVQLGGDPQVEKHAKRDRAHLTLGNVIGKYLAGYAERRLGPRTLVEVRRALTTQWKPLHEASADTLTRGAVASRLAEIAEESGPFAANRARSYLSAALNWAIEQGIVDENPVHATGKLAKEISRERVLSDAELAEVWQQVGWGDYASVIKLLLLTGQRREEVAGMLWSEVNFDNALWSIGANRTKNGRPHDVPLTDSALSILEKAERRQEREYVFGRGDGPFSGWSKAKVALDKRILAARRAIDPKAKPMPPWRIHDLRRTAATRMADLGVQPHVIEAVLNHVSGHRAGVAGTYNRAMYSAEKKAALKLWAEHLRQFVASAVE